MAIQFDSKWREAWPDVAPLAFLGLPADVPDAELLRIAAAPSEDTA